MKMPRLEGINSEVLFNWAVKHLRQGSHVVSDGLCGSQNTTYDASPFKVG